MALIVVTGGARSGKSSIAQKLALQRERDGVRVVVVAFGDGLDDPEMAARIDRHRQQRPVGFETVEARDAESWTASVPDDVLLVVDCLGTLLARLMTEVRGEAPELDSGREEEIERRLDALVRWVTLRAGDTVVVTNEVGDGVVPAYASGRFFRDELGRANRVLAAQADRAYLVVCGRALDLADVGTTPSWPED